MNEWPWLQEEDEELEEERKVTALQAQIASRLLKQRTVVLAGEMDKRLAEKAKNIKVKTLNADSLSL